MREVDLPCGCSWQLTGTGWMLKQCDGHANAASRGFSPHHPYCPYLEGKDCQCPLIERVIEMTEERLRG